MKDTALLIVIVIMLAGMLFISEHYNSKIQDILESGCYQAYTQEATNERRSGY